MDIGIGAGNLIQAAGATPVAELLTSSGGIAGNASLLGIANASGMIAGFTANGGLLQIVNGQSLALAGTVGATAAGTVDIATLSGGMTQLDTGTLTTGTLTSSGGFVGSVSLAGVANAIGSIGSIAVAGANGTFALNNAADLTLSNTLRAHQIVVTNATRAIAAAPGAKIVTDCTIRPNTTLAISDLPFNTPQTPGAQGGAYFSAANFVQKGSLAVSGLNGPSSVPRIDTTASRQFDAGFGLNGPATWLILGLNNGGTGSGAIAVRASDVTYSRPGSANLTGTINGKTGVEAAFAGYIKPSASPGYKMNVCTIGAVNCGNVSDLADSRPWHMLFPGREWPLFVMPMVCDDMDACRRLLTGMP